MKLINNNLQQNKMKLLKLLIFVILGIMIISFIPAEWFSKENIKDLFSIFTTPELKHWINENIAIILIIGVGGGLYLIQLYTAYINSKEYKKRKKNKEQTTNNVVIIVCLLLIVFFVIKTDFIGKYITGEIEKDTLIYPKYIDYNALYEVKPDDTIKDYFANETSKAISTRNVINWTKEQTEFHFKDNDKFQSYLSFYLDKTYKFNSNYLNTWFLPSEIERIKLYFKP